MKIHAKVGYIINVSIDTKEVDPEKIRKKIIEHSDKIFNRQFSEGEIIMCSVPEVVEKEVLLWED